MLSNRRNLIILGTVLLGVVGLGLILYLNVRPEPQIEGVVQFPRPARGHDDALVFDESVAWFDNRDTNILTMPIVLTMFDVFFG